MLLGIVAFDIVPWFRGDAPWIPDDGQWVWPYTHPHWPWLILSAVTLVLYVAGSFLVLWQSRRVLLMVWTFSSFVLLSLLLLYLDESPLFELLTRLSIQGHYHGVVPLILNFGDTLRDWPGFTDQVYQQTHQSNGVVISPPGLAVIYYANTRVLDHLPLVSNSVSAIVRPMQCQDLIMANWTDAQWASTWIQILMPFWSALSIAPLYRLGTHLFDRPTARLAVIIWPLVPGLTFFQPTFNVIYPLMTLVMLVFLWQGLLYTRPGSIFLAGFTLSAGIFFNLTLVPLGLLAGLIILGYHLLIRVAPLQRAALLNLLRDGLLFGIGTTSIWLIYWIVGGSSPFAIIKSNMSQHYELNRPYFSWLIMHPLDMFLFVGFPLSFFVAWRAVRLRRENITPKKVFVGSAVLTLFVLVLSGSARGETGRVWLFFAPVWVLMAADILVGLRVRDRVVFLVLQAMCLLAIASVLRWADYAALIRPSNPAEAKSAPTFPVDAQFSRGDDRITFVGLDVETAPTTVTLHLHWRAETPIKHAYVLTLVSIPPDESERESIEWTPEDWNYPPSCWRAGREFVDTLVVPLGDLPLPGNWLFSLAILDAFTFEPMQVINAAGESSFQVGIGPVHVQ